MFSLKILQMKIRTDSTISMRLPSRVKAYIIKLDLQSPTTPVCGIYHSVIYWTAVRKKTSTQLLSLQLDSTQKEAT